MLPGKSNYFVGNDPNKWHTDVPTYAKVRYINVYPGIDLLYYGNQEGRLEHDFVVAPGADPNAIAIGLRDCDGAVPDQLSGLTVHTRNGDLTLQSPTVYQITGGERRTIPATYQLVNNQIKFQLGTYDRNAPLVIDPIIQYTGAFGGSGYEAGTSIAVDISGNVYVSGFTDSTNLPVVNPFRGSWTPGAGGNPTSYVAKVNASGTALLYSSYLGGSIVTANGIAVDSLGRAYVVGQLVADLPTKNAFQSEPKGPLSAFLTVFGPTGNTLIFSTYLGGSGWAAGKAIALDSLGSAYITGETLGGFPTLHSLPTQGGAGIFTAKFDKTGALKYSSVLELKPTEVQFSESNAIAVDTTGAAYIAGTFRSAQSFPVTQNAYRFPCVYSDGGWGCVFAVKFNPSGDSLAYASVLGHGQMVGNAIAVDSSGNAYIAGITVQGFPVYKSSYQPVFGGGSNDAFVTKLNATGSNLLASTYLGGNDYDHIIGLVLDQHRQVYVVGVTWSSNFPLKASLTPFAGPYHSFLTTLSGSLNSIVYYSTLFDLTLGPQAIAVDKLLNVYVTGAAAANSPVTPGALNRRGSAGDIFVSKLVIMDDLALGISGPSGSVARGGNFNYTIAVTSKGPDFGYNVRIDDPMPAGTTFVSYNAGGGTCTAPPVGATGTLHCTLPQLNKGQTYTVTLTVKVNAVAGTTLSNTATTLSNMQDFVQSNNKGTLVTKVN